jgi:hypothetical protein
MKTPKIQLITLNITNEVAIKKDVQLSSDIRQLTGILVQYAGKQKDRTLAGEISVCNIEGYDIIQNNFQLMAKPVHFQEDVLEINEPLSINPTIRVIYRNLRPGEEYQVKIYLFYSEN